MTKSVRLERETKETRISGTLALGTGRADIQLAPAFPKHMLETLAKWSGLDVTLHVESKDDISHHAIEDAAIVLGQGLRELVDRNRIQRVGHAVIPMDDALVLAAIDLVDRPWYEGELPDPMMEHVLRSFATEAGANLHVQVIRGRDKHHVVEAAFKATARALAAALTPREEGISTKGAVDVRVESA